MIGTSQGPRPASSQIQRYLSTLWHLWMFAPLSLLLSVTTVLAQATPTPTPNCNPNKLPACGLPNTSTNHPMDCHGLQAHTFTPGENISVTDSNCQLSEVDVNQPNVVISGPSASKPLIVSPLYPGLKYGFRISADNVAIQNIKMIPSTYINPTINGPNVWTHAIQAASPYKLRNAT